MRKALQYLTVLAVLLILGTITVPNILMADPPAFTPNRAVPKESFIRITYAPGGEFLGSRDRFVPPGSPYEAYEATIRSALIEIAAAAGRPDQVARAQREAITIYDNTSLGGEQIFSTDSPTSGITKIADPGATTESAKRKGGGNISCTCASLVCSADVCGRWHCSGGCGACNICG